MIREIVGCILKLLGILTAKEMSVLCRDYYNFVLTGNMITTLKQLDQDQWFYLSGNEEVDNLGKY